MSKQWFLEIAMQAPPSPLAGVISDILSKKDESELPVIAKSEASTPPAVSEAAVSGSASQISH